MLSAVPAKDHPVGVAVCRRRPSLAATLSSACVSPSESASSSCACWCLSLKYLMAAEGAQVSERIGRNDATYASPTPPSSVSSPLAPMTGMKVFCTFCMPYASSFFALYLMAMAAQDTAGRGYVCNVLSSSISFRAASVPQMPQDHGKKQVSRCGRDWGSFNICCRYCAVWGDPGDVPETSRIRLTGLCWPAQRAPPAGPRGFDRSPS